MSVWKRFGMWLASLLAVVNLSVVAPAVAQDDEADAPCVSCPQADDEMRIRRFHSDVF